jgi:hypothetical protein
MLLPLEDPFLCTALLRVDPTAHVLGAIDEDGTRRFHTRQKRDRISIDERHIGEIEKDAAIGLRCHEGLQVGDLTPVHVSADQEGHASGIC